MVVSIATVLKSIELDPGMNLPVKFHQNRLTPLASRAVHYIQTYRQTENLRRRLSSDHPIIYVINWDNGKVLLKYMLGNPIKVGLFKSFVKHEEDCF